MKSWEKLVSWLKIVRLQFYPMIWIAYSAGAAAAYLASRKFDLGVYLTGYAILFLIELSAVLSNEYYDYPSDRVNKNASMFTGGSGVLVQGKLGFAEVRTAIFAAVFLVLLLTFVLVRISGAAARFTTLALIAAGLFLALGYTVPPLKFCYRGLGELVVSFTHSAYVMVCGYAFQTGQWHSSLPWLFSIPLFLATFTAITLAGIPDFSADLSVSKKTIAVLLGPRRAAIISVLSAVLAAVGAVILLWLKMVKGSASLAMLVVVPHGLALALAVVKFLREGNFDRRINGIMQMALSYIVWFGLVPLAYLTWAKRWL